MSEDNVVGDDVDLVEVDLDAIDVNVCNLCDDVVVDVNVLLDDVDVDAFLNFFADDDDARVVVVNFFDVVVDDVANDNVDVDAESYDVDDDFAVVVMDELFEGDVDGDNDDDNGFAVSYVGDEVKRLVLQDDDDNDGGDDHCRDAW